MEKSLPFITIILCVIFFRFWKYTYFYDNSNSIWTHGLDVDSQKYFQHPFYTNYSYNFLNTIDNINESYILKCIFNLILPIWGSFWPETTNRFTFSVSTGCFKHENIWLTAFLSLTFTPITIQPVQIGFRFNKAWE